MLAVRVMENLQEELADGASDKHSMSFPDQGSFHYVLKVHNGVESLSPAFIEAHPDNQPDADPNA